MDSDLLFDNIIIDNNTLSKEDREEIVYDLINIYQKMPHPVKDVGVNTFINLSDKALVLTLISAYEVFAIKHFLFCGIEPSKVVY